MLLIELKIHNNYRTELFDEILQKPWNSHGIGIGNTFQITCFAASTTSCRVWISRKAGTITRSIADILVNERFHSGKNSLAYHHWLLTFSSLPIIEIMWQIYMRSVTSFSCFLRVFFFTGDIQGGTLVKLGSTACIVQYIWKKDVYFSTIEDKWPDTINTVQETFILRSPLLLSYYYEY